MMRLQIRLDLGVIQQRPNVDHQLQQVRRVLPVETRVKVLLLFRFLQFLEQLALLLIGLRPRCFCTRGFGPFRHGGLENQPASERRAKVVARFHQLQDLKLPLGLHIDQLLGRLQIDFVRVKRLYRFRVQFIEQAFVESVPDALHPQCIGDCFLVQFL